MLWWYVLCACQARPVTTLEEFPVQTMCKRGKLGKLAKAPRRKYHVKQPEMAARMSSGREGQNIPDEWQGQSFSGVEKQLPFPALQIQSNLIGFFVSTTQELNFPKRNC